MANKEDSVYKDLKLDCGCCRETTLEEDINALLLDEETKRKLLRKNSEREELLRDRRRVCDKLETEISELRNAVIYLSKFISNAPIY